MKVKPKHRQFDPAIKKRINMALQGGGAHGAFGWGVMDKFLEDGRKVRIFRSNKEVVDV